jgi:hypothetical protein
LAEAAQPAASPAPGSSFPDGRENPFSVSAKYLSNIDISLYINNLCELSRARRQRSFAAEKWRPGSGIAAEMGNPPSRRSHALSRLSGVLCVSHKAYLVIDKPASKRYIGNRFDVARRQHRPAATEQYIEVPTEPGVFADRTFAA